MTTIVTPAVLQALMVGYSRKFQEGQSMASSQYLKVATKVPSAGKSTTYGWLGKWPAFREWIGDRVINAMAAHAYSLVNKPFESSIGVDRDDIEDDEFLHIEDIEQTADLLDDTSDAPVIRLVNQMISQSVKAGASDIHIEPFQDELKVRYRIDGILYEMMAPKRTMMGVMSLWGVIVSSLVEVHYRALWV